MVLELINRYEKNMIKNNILFFQAVIPATRGPNILLYWVPQQEQQELTKKMDIKITNINKKDIQNPIIVIN